MSTVYGNLLKEIIW